MSEQLSFDRAKGFVALPVEVLEIELTPGAFRLLVELCRMANVDGYCWPSLDQLSGRIGRSKSAISGYIKELRAEGLVDTETQTTANGYNYRLKYRVTFWQDWRASLTGAVRSKPERSVQPAERLKESKNQINLNHCLPTAEVDQLVKDWGRCFHGAPYPAASLPPSEALITQTNLALSAEIQEDISADISDWLWDFWTTRKIAVTAKMVAGQAQSIAKSYPSLEEFQLITKALSRAWQPHWRRPPDAEAFTKLVGSAKITTAFQKHQLLKSYRNRWMLAQKTLRNAAHSGSLAATTRVAA